MIILKSVHKSGANTKDYISLAQLAVEKVNQTLLLPEFKEKVLAAKFSEIEISNQEVYDLLVSDMELDVVFFYGSFMENRIWKTVGKEIGDGKVYANTFFVKKTDTIKLGSLILHEASHIKGFHHYKVKSTSVPYQLNKIFEVING